MNDLVLKEVWRDIDGFEGLYQVSNLGRVKSLKRAYHPTESIISQKIHLVGNYKMVIVNLWKDGKNHVHRVHRLVANAFIENPNNYGYVNHIDSNSTNNDISNLEWCTAKQNADHGMRFGRVSERVKVSSKQCLEIAQMYDSKVPIKEIAKIYGITHRNVYKYAKEGGCSKRSLLTSRRKYNIDPYELKRLFDMGYSQASIAKAYGCSNTTICNLHKKYKEGELI